MKLVTKRTFAASHRLPDHMGKCKGLHGHNWKVRVMMEGEQIIKPGDPQNGMLVDFQNVKGIIDALDHSDLNILFNEDEPPTAENIARYLGYQLYRLQDNIHRVIVHIWESEDSFIEWDSETDLELDYKIKESLTESLSDVKTPEDVSKQREANKDILNGDSDESESQ